MKPWLYRGSGVAEGGFYKYTIIFWCVSIGCRECPDGISWAIALWPIPAQIYIQFPHNQSPRIGARRMHPRPL